MEYFIDREFPFREYKGKSVLIIGGGPSTIDVKWQNVKTDYIWSCNDFYLNKRLLETKLDLVAMGNLQDYTNSSLLEYLDKGETKILIEDNHIRTTTLQNNKSFYNRYKSRVHRGHVDKEYTGIVGPPSRLITLACNLGMSDIYYVGIDGFDKSLKNIHAFTNEDGLRGEASHDSYDKYYNHITEFFKRVYRDFGSRTNFHNLGEVTNAHNIPSFVSKELYPLSNEILEVLG